MLKSRWKRITDCWQQQNVAVIRNACAAEMRMTEAVNHRIGIVIPGATIPTREPRIRTELDHSERHDCARKRVAMSARANERIDVTREIALRGDVQCNQEQHAREADNSLDRIYKIVQDLPDCKPFHLETSCKSCTHGAAAIA